MACLEVSVSVKDSKLFRKLLKTMKKITDDNRIPEDIRYEYLKEIEVIMMCEQNTLPVEDLEEDSVAETTEESEESADEE